MAEFTTPTPAPVDLAAVERMFPKVQAIFAGETVPDILATIVHLQGAALGAATDSDEEAATMARAIAGDVMRCVGEYRRNRIAADGETAGQA